MSRAASRASNQSVNLGDARVRIFRARGEIGGAQIVRDLPEPITITPSCLQRAQRAADAKVMRGVEARLDRQLRDGHVGLAGTSAASAPTRRDRARAGCSSAMELTRYRGAKRLQRRARSGAPGAGYRISYSWRGNP